MSHETILTKSLAVQILAMGPDAKTILETTKSTNVLRFTHRRDGGIDLTLTGRNGDDNVVLKINLDLLAALDALSQGISELNFQPETYDTVSNMTRGVLKKSSWGDYGYRLQPDEINAKKQIANYDKWCRENSYLQKITEIIIGLQYAASRARESYQKSFTRSMRRIYDSQHNLD